MRHRVLRSLQELAGKFVQVVWNLLLILAALHIKVVRANLDIITKGSLASAVAGAG